VRQINKRAAAALAVAGCAVAVGAAAVPASADAATLKFFQKSTGSHFLGPDGQPLTNPMMITPGSSFSATDLDYVGTHKRHASTATASDHIACTFTTQSLGTCNGQIAIGGFMLLANAVTVNFAASNITVPINGGTGKYAHARGSATSVGIGNTNNSDFTVRYRT
jgi:hypothetical protein